MTAARHHDHRAILLLRRWRWKLITLRRGYFGRDLLTGLGTGVQGWRRLRRGLRRARAGAVIFCDLDHFKSFNQMNAFSRGDELLTLVAAILSSLSEHPWRGYGRDAYRIGGDEFMILLPGKNLQTARDLAEEARLKIRELPTVLGATQADAHPLSARFAVAAWDDGQAPAYPALCEAAERVLRDPPARDAVVTIGHQTP